MPQETYNQLRDAIKAEVEHFGKDAVLTVHEQHNDTRMMFNLCYRAAFQLQNDDTHPFFTQNHRPRTSPFISREWSIYNGGCNDDHVATALKAIQKELGLTR
jgi:hypothetical protein